MNVRNGFSLIELLVVVTILSIMVAVALPVYSDHLVRTRRFEAQVTLNKLALMAEKYHIEHGCYTGMVVPPALQGRFYRFSVEAAQAGYVLTAAPLGVQAQKDTGCGVLRLDDAGGRKYSGWKTERECW